jgi:hypothetical protein
MSENYGTVNNDLAKKIVHEYNLFMKETREKMDEARRATMIALRKLLKLKDGDIIEIREDDTLQIIAAKETSHG